MKIKFALSAGLVLLSGLGLAFAAAPGKTITPAVSQEDAKTRDYKDILFKLVRQDEYLDEAMETLDGANGRMRAHDLSAMGLSLKMIAGNLDRVAALNKTEFSSVQAGSMHARYINTIFSYSSKVNRKAVKVSAVIGRMAAKYKKSAMRDAVSSRKNGIKVRGKKVRGKKLTQLLEERKAMDTLAADAKVLRAAARGVSATSKWLYISAK
ncbi:MAG: hypothetical protein A2081_02425 [Elusimicrobia bacterium GWC2_61_19]|nr:MAG: hypothetical protein A2081_02425 [Elusimicrobia bacterium GWC2_61_19]